MVLVHCWADQDDTSAKILYPKTWLHELARVQYCEPGERQ